MSIFLAHAARIILGLIFLVAGLNGWAVILGMEPFAPTSPQAMALLTGYLLVLEKSTEVVCGLLLVCNRFLPAALAILAPIVANILLFHLFSDPALLPLAILVTLLETFLLFMYRESFKPLLKKNAKPGR